MPARGTVRIIIKWVRRDDDERGVTLILTAMVLPILVVFAALGIGGAVVRATADETQRAAELSALAAATSQPNLGRPTASGVPDVPASFPPALPPGLKDPANIACSVASTTTPSVTTPQPTVTLPPVTAPPVTAPPVTAPPVTLPPVTAPPVTVPPTSPTTTPPSSPYSVAGAYYQIAQTQDCVSRRIAQQLNLGPISNLNDLFGPWHQGCDVAQAQYASGRARMSRNFALDASGPKTPVCPQGTPGAFPANHPERVYIRPEMESTGAYELQKCLVNQANCFNSVSTTASQELHNIGVQYQAVTNAVPGKVTPPDQAACIVNPSATGCPFNEAELANMLAAQHVPRSAAVAHALATAMPQQMVDLAGYAYARAATGVDYTNGVYSSVQPITSSIEQLVGAAFLTSVPGLCTIDLGPASGQQLCGSGINLASMLPTTLSPRVRSIISHSIEVPWVPNWANAGEEGDFTFSEQALARRTFKNAIVVPTIPKQLDVPPAVVGGVSACYRGAALVNQTVSTTPPFVLPSQLATLANTLSGTATVQAGATTDTCRNADLDNAVADPTTCHNGDLTVTAGQRRAACTVSQKLAAIIDTVNNVPASTQKQMIDAAYGFNSMANQAVNQVVAQQLKAEDPSGNYDAADCNTTDSSNHPQKPAAWCVDAAGQQIKDMQDFFGSPPDGTGPTYNDVLNSAADSGEPLAIMGLSSTIDMCDPSVAAGLCTAINAYLQASGVTLTPQNTVTSLPLFIPALDTVPVLVHRDANSQTGFSFELAQNASSTPGLYRAILIDPDEAYPLCPAGTSNRLDCVGQSSVV
ncbi:MAG: hypothetical protein QOG03_1247, partial [Actinomycetota bacterium]|nr:hypothetical protein [Actinomycetota bacterium]